MFQKANIRQAIYSKVYKGVILSIKVRNKFIDPESGPKASPKNYHKSICVYFYSSSQQKFSKKNKIKCDWRSIQLSTPELQARMPLTLGGELSSYFCESTEFITFSSPFFKKVCLISGSRTLLSEWLKVSLSPWCVSILRIPVFPSSSKVSSSRIPLKATEPCYLQLLLYLLFLYWSLGFCCLRNFIFHLLFYYYRRHFSRH